MNRFLTLGMALVLANLLTGCELVGDIFSAGVYTGVFLVVLVIVIIVYVVVKIGKRG